MRLHGEGLEVLRDLDSGEVFAFLVPEDLRPTATLLGFCQLRNLLLWTFHYSKEE